jgi:hypothetical protein
VHCPFTQVTLDFGGIDFPSNVHLLLTQMMHLSAMQVWEFPPDEYACPLAEEWPVVEEPDFDLFNEDCFVPEV